LTIKTIQPRNNQGVTDTTETAIWSSLTQVIDPEIRKPITELGMVSDVSVNQSGHATVKIVLTIAGCPAANQITNTVTKAVASTPGVTAQTITVGVMTPAQRSALTERLRGDRATRPIPFGPGTLTRVYGVTSGKGGVGKSTITANLAVVLAQQGLTVGIVDADVYGFSIPGILGLTTADGSAVKPTRVEGMILPPIAYDVKVISIGMFLDALSGPGSAVAWRGPMLHRTLQQFLSDVYFGDLDVLLLDLPPGTGDMAISLGQLLPNAEILVVTTPQAAAADIAERSGIVARQTGQHIAGVIENMAGLTQTDGSILNLFGTGGGKEVARRLSTNQPEPVHVLASIPLSISMRSGGDTGIPVVLHNPDDPASTAIRSVALQLSTQPRGLADRQLGIQSV
jgi:ATP-binding protein involved in chromosome partitioning